MDREPIVFTWRSAPTEHGLALALTLGLGGPLALLALLCLRDLVGVLAAAPDHADAFLRVAAALPWRPAGSEPFVLLEGWAYPAAERARLAFLLLSGTAVAAAALAWGVARLCFLAQSRTVERLNAHVTDTILRAPPAARDDARALSQGVGDLLARIDTLFGLGLVVPALALGSTLLALGLAWLAAPRLVPTVAVGIAAAGLARALIQGRMQARSALRLRSGATFERALTDLIRRMPAVRAHGAASFERTRLAAKGEAARAALARAEAALAYARAPSVALAILLPAIVVADALWQGDNGAPVAPGALVATGGGFALAVVALAVALHLRTIHREVAPIFRSIAQALPALEGRGPARPARLAAFPEVGTLEAHGVGAYDPATGERLGAVDLAVAMPGHVAILGERGGGGRALAALLAGQLEPTAGSVTYGGIDLRAFEPEERAGRIALAGAEAILVEGSLRQNILYGAASRQSGTGETDDLLPILAVTGLDAIVYARGLEGTVDPSAEPGLARAVVAARHAVRAALAADKAGRLVEPFDPGRYNHQATVGENILFGEAVGPAFAPERIAAHPYLRAVLEAEDLTRPLAEVGLQVARSLGEIFADLPDDHPLFDAFSLFPASERGFFEDLVARMPEAKAWRRGPAGQRDRKRLIGLALRYSETRHRLGLVDAAFETRIVAARHAFARMLPPSLRGSIEFYDPATLTAAASLEENLLFGRINGEEAGAEARVRALVRQVLADEGLEPAVYRLGLDSRVEPGLGGGGASLGENAIGPRERVAIDLARCLVRQPDIAVVAIALEDRKVEEIRPRLAALRAARAGRGLIVCLPDAAVLDEATPFDAVLRVERNTVVAA
ncbi:ABC transporter ATP-binding protein/permease [Methylobacterium gossipiicola]|uniref:ABC transmembrane type-1 domain-containing protein n=1 Tax=Methylobacterium gossipiicola TaxID=582675 RepID=A0A1I2QQ36_9HYPH|nr:ABC transporter ATP-binding protein/permease [Methylobacterium gossipiicola]SFG30715.1 hypothetical protein SAMN05192565_101316 [Methylobacterium gossipiicola]